MFNNYSPDTVRVSRKVCKRFLKFLCQIYFDTLRWPFASLVIFPLAVPDFPGAQGLQVKHFQSVLGFRASLFAFR